MARWQSEAVGCRSLPLRGPSERKVVSMTDATRIATIPTPAGFRAMPSTMSKKSMRSFCPSTPGCLQSAAAKTPQAQWLLDTQLGVRLAVLQSSCCPLGMVV